MPLVHGPFNKGEFTATDATADVAVIPHGDPARAISFQNKSDFDVYMSPATGYSYIQGVLQPGLPHAVYGQGVLVRAHSDVTVDDANYTPHQGMSLGNNTPSMDWYAVCDTDEEADVTWQRY